MKRGPALTLVVIVAIAAVLLTLDLTKARSGATSGPTTATVAPAAAPVASAPAAPAQAPPPAAAPAPPAPTPTAFPSEARYTGHTDGTPIAIAVTVRGNKASAYLCDGKSVEGWYQGTVGNGSIDAKGKDSSALSGSLTGQSLSGTVSAHGKSWTYTADPVKAPAGLYRAKTGKRTVGWIKYSDGSVTGLAHDGDVESPAPPLDTAAAQSVSGDDTVVSK